MDRLVIGNSSANEAEKNRADQALLIKQAAISDVYSRELETVIDEKHEQIERLVANLDDQIDQAETLLQQRMQSRPGILSLPSTRQAWQEGVDRIEARLAQLHERLEFVKEIEEETSIQGGAVQQMAREKLRRKDADLVRRYEEEQQQARKAQAEERRRRQEERSSNKTENRAREAAGRSLARDF